MDVAIPVNTEFVPLVATDVDPAGAVPPEPIVTV
jgi:hypothetical protein